MTKLAALFARLDLPESVRTPLGQLAALITAVALLCLLAGLWLHFHDDAVIDRHEAQREAAAAPARDQAAEERASDAVANAQSEQEMHDVINAAPTGGTLSPAAHALACERLRKLGRVPAACRSDGGGGSEAGSR